GAGLGIVLTINLLLIIYFVDIYRKQRPHESPHKKSLCFCDFCHETQLFSRLTLLNAVSGLYHSYNILYSINQYHVPFGLNIHRKESICR
ncbi:hypothetical protein N6P31_22540, partial [Pectobacterium betavasculorum]|uniref:hypothetical protein n=1 Tax=Pectobacterium betavasculorum TaxID=55207 RepID=UPI00313ADADA